MLTLRVVLNRQSGKPRGHVREMPFVAVWHPRLAVIHRKRAKHFAFARHYRGGPASRHTNRPPKDAIFIPERVGRNVADDYRLTPVHSRPARAMLRSNRTAVNHLNVTIRKIRRHCMSDVVAIVAKQDY